MTLVDLDQKLALKSVIGGFIGSFGALGGWMIIGKTKRDWSLKITGKTVEKTMIVLALSLISFAIQSILITFGKAKLPFAALSNTPTTLTFFYIGMAYFETLFFPFFLYRGFKEVFMLAKISPFNSAILSMLLTSSAFGFAYHAAVYNNDIIYMANAFIGNMIFCLGMDLTDTFSGGYFPHLLQNIPLSMLAYSTLNPTTIFLPIAIFPLILVPTPNFKSRTTLHKGARKVIR